MATQAFDVIIRRIATGCDFRIRLFAKDWETAAERATDRARFSEGMRKMDYHNLRQQGHAVFRVVSCEVSDDQTRPLSF
jgi:hypothetical protein